jgi:hypothetical protein
VPRPHRGSRVARHRGEGRRRGPLPHRWHLRQWRRRPTPTRVSVQVRGGVLWITRRVAGSGVVTSAPLAGIRGQGPLTLTRSTLRFALRERIVPANVADDVSPKGKAAADEKSYTAEQVKILRAAGMPDGVIAVRMGHDENVMRATYGVPHAAEQAAAAEVMARLLG